MKPYGWKISKHVDNDDIVVRDNDGSIIANCSIDCYKTGVKKRARLMAASPDLFYAVNQVLVASEDGGDMDDINWGLLRKAWRKAGGRL